MTKPVLTLVIGANGAGKSTWCREHRDELPQHFYDADSIAQGLGSYDDPADQMAARQIVDERIAAHIEKQESFGFESTYSGASRPNVVRLAHQRGYAVHAFFLGTHSPIINIRRVVSRVATQTGHHVDESEVRRRWGAAQDNLVRTAALFERISILNSSETTADVVAEFLSNQEGAPSQHRPRWAARLADRVRAARQAVDQRYSS